MAHDFSDCYGTHICSDPVVHTSHLREVCCTKHILHTFVISLWQLLVSHYRTLHHSEGYVSPLLHHHTLFAAYSQLLGGLVSQLPSIQALVRVWVPLDNNNIKILLFDIRSPGFHVMTSDCR